MTIKVQCQCGTRYSFDVEPQNGFMPFRVNCPTCNADGTETANQIIAQSQQTAPRLRMASAGPAPAPVPQEVPALPPEAPPLPPPPRCGPSAATRQLEREARQTRIIGRVILAGLLLAAVLLGADAWYNFVGSKPRLASSFKLSDPDSAWRMQFLPHGELLLASPARVVLRSVPANKELWSQSLPGQDSTGGNAPNVFVNHQDIWVCNGSQVARLDETSGAVKQTIPISGRFVSFKPTESNILIMSATGETSRVAMQIDLSSGEASTRSVDVPQVEKRTTPDDLPPNVQPTADVLLAQATEPGGKFSQTLNAVSSEFFSTGRNLVELRVKLVEPKIDWVKSIKPRGPSLINGNTTASTSTAGVEEEVFNDIKRDKTGGVKPVDKSLYDVRVRRWLGSKPVEWEDKVTGLPVFFSLKTVDLLTAGNLLTVFDKQNNPLFQAKLSYPIADRFARDNVNHIPPAAERDGVLYFFDQGVLTAFGLPGGDVRWRLTSIGISRVQFDGEGMLYVDSTAASPEDIQYSDQIKFESTPPVILKVDPATGRILWQVQKLGQQAIPSGKFLYTVSVNQGGSAMLAGLADAVNAPRQEGPAYFHVHRLDPATGRELWDFYREDAPLGMGFQQNWFVVRFGSQVEAFKYLDF